MGAKFKSHLIASVLTLIFAAIGFYILLPAISIHNPGILINVVVLCVFYTAVFAISYRKNYTFGIVNDKGHLNFKEIITSVKITGIIAALAVVIFAVGSVSGAVIFNAKRYRELLEVSEGDFQKDVDAISYEQIPTLDSASAIRLGDKKLGELSDMVSQFSVMDDYYTQINYNGTPVRVTPLQYVDVFKWLNNVKNGVPGYIMINMVTQEVSLMRFSDMGYDNMKYSTAEHFGRNLYRHLRFKYPTYIFAEPTFEINDDGVPFWVCAKINYKIGLYGGCDVGGVVLVNAITGECEYHGIDDVPSWVDRVYNANLIIEQFDYYGTLKHGFWNSVFGQRDCQETTAGYNYIAMDDDVFMYTGITSVAADQSNIGFILTNQRTKETKFYEIAGAEEFSAMSSAEGEVQNLRYEATFPLLLNIGNEPTYFVALKDDAGLVRMYAMINVKQYQIVATGQTLKECEENYIRLITDSDIITESPKEVLTISGTVTDIRTAVIDSNSWYFFKLDGFDKTFMLCVADNTEIVTYNVGDTVTVKYSESENSVINAVSITKD